MPYETDYSPADYLKRRIIYYKKKRGSVRNYNKSEFFIRQYGGIRKLNGLIKLMVNRIEERISEYEKAIKKIERTLKQG